MLRGVGTGGKLAIAGMTLFALGLALAALYAGWWLYSLFALLMSVLFLLSAPFVLGKRWAAPRPESTRRPVVRRRR
jgi:uncharacterized protein (DUF58 family)